MILSSSSHGRAWQWWPLREDSTPVPSGDRAGQRFVDTLRKGLEAWIRCLGPGSDRPAEAVRRTLSRVVREPALTASHGILSDGIGCLERDDVLGSESMSFTQRQIRQVGARGPADADDVPAPGHPLQPQSHPAAP